MAPSSQNGKLIVLCGPDGSGKTSLSRLLVGMLKDDGYEVQYVWCRFESGILAFWLGILGKILQPSEKAGQDYEKRMKRKHDIFYLPVIRWLYLAYVLLAYMREIHTRIGRPHRAGKAIVSDRYTYDTAIDLWIDFGMRHDYLATMVSLVDKLAPVPDLILVVDVPADVALARKSDIPTLEYSSERRAGYLQLARILNVVPLNGTKPLNENAGRLKEKIVPVLNTNQKVR